MHSAHHTKYGVCIIAFGLISLVCTAAQAEESACEPGWWPMGPAWPRPYTDWRCYGESCGYPQGLLANTDLKIRRGPSEASSVSFPIQRGTRVIASEGVQVTETPGQLRITSPVAVGDDMAQPGDRVYEYSAYGEGYVLTWFRGKFLICQTALWVSHGKAVREKEPVVTDWMNIRDRGGRTGWVAHQFQLVRDAKGATIRLDNLELIAGGNESAGCGKVPHNFFTSNSLGCR